MSRKAPCYDKSDDDEMAIIAAFERKMGVGITQLLEAGMIHQRIVHRYPELNDEIERMVKLLTSGASTMYEVERAELRAKGGRAKAANNPQQVIARKSIRAEYERWQVGAARYVNDADFARKMHARHATAYKNEGSIKNAIARWRKEQPTSSC